MRRADAGALCIDVREKLRPLVIVEVEDECCSSLFAVRDLREEASMEKGGAVEADAIERVCRDMPLRRACPKVDCEFFSTFIIGC